MRLNLNREYPVLEAENRIYFGTPSGLYQYNAGDDTYKRVNLPVDGRLPEVRELYYADEWLWCVLDSGLAALHIRLNEWLYFDAANGLPWDVVNGLAVLEDYVYAATANWSARYDLLIEEWEVIDGSLGAPDSSVRDVATTAEAVWLVTEHLFSEYDPRFEKWRHYSVQHDTTALLDRAFVLGTELFIVSDRGLLRFDTGLKTQQFFAQPYLMPENLLEIVIEDNTIWAVTRQGLYSYEQTSGVWREFEGNEYLLGSETVNGYVSRSEIYVLTASNVLVWHREEKTWEILDYASGLSSSRFSYVYVRGSLAFLLNRGGIDYRVNRTDMWRRYAISDVPETPGISGRDIFKSLFDNEAGGYIPLGKYRWGWEGTSINLIYNYRQRYDSEGKGMGADIVSGERLDIKSQLALSGLRTLTGFYNNIDYTETMYGIRYRSRALDFLRELSWGDARRESGGLPFTESASVFGSGIWLQAGDKTPRFKRSFVTIRGDTGERRSQKTYEFREGVTVEGSAWFQDVDYIRNQFYAVPGVDVLGVITGVEIYIDDLIPSNNTPNTIEGGEIAGVTGDFDLSPAAEDYYLYDRAGVIRFTRYLGPDWTVVIRFNLNGLEREGVLQYGGAVTTARRNFYALGAPGIIPYSLVLRIWDDGGNEVPVGDFGLDEDGDGVVDSNWLDFENGIIFFPDPEPFPPPVYDQDDPISFYSLYTTFRTALPVIRLKHSNLVRGSEVLRLDGVIAEVGNDYVLDYTNGTLVFVREGIVNDDTRMEIEYEYQVTEDNTRLHSALINVSPSDNLYVNADWMQFTPTQNETPGTEEASNLFAVHGEIREALGDYDLRLIPALCYQAEDSEISGGHLEGYLSSARLRLETRYVAYTENYSNVYRPQFVFGDVKSDMDFAGTFDITEYFRLTGEWRDLKGFVKREGHTPQDRSALLGFLLHHEAWPSWEFAYQDFRTTSARDTVDRYFVESRVEYGIPRAVSRGLRLQDLKMELFLRSGRRAGESLMETEEQRFHQGFFRVNANISDRFQTGLFYRRNDLNDTTPGRQSAPVTRAERMLFDFSHEEWRLFQTNIRIENTLDRGFHRNSSLADATVNLFSQLNVRLSPGAVWRTLSPLFFEFNANQSLRGWGTTGGNVGGWLWRMFSFDSGDLDDSFRIRNYYVRNEFRPSPDWFIYSLVQWNERRHDPGISLLESGYWRWTEKADLKVGYNTRLNLRYNQHSEGFGYDRKLRYLEPSAWLEHRWTPDLQNTFFALYRRTHSDDRDINDTSDDLEGRVDLIWRKPHYMGLKRIEFRQTLSGNHSRTGGYHVRRTYDITWRTGLDIYPLHSTVVRFQMDITRHLDRVVPLNDYTSVYFDVRTSFRF